MARKFDDKWDSCGITMYQVPNYSEDPGDDMVDFMNSCPHEWTGDECGVNITLGDTEYQAAPGMWVCRFVNLEEGTELWSVVDETVGNLWHLALTAAAPDKSSMN